MAFNRNSGGRGGDRGGFRPRPSFGGGRGGVWGRGGGERGPVEKNDAIFGNIGKACQVPFRPTSGKPIFCSSCFENKREGGDSRGGDRSYDNRTSVRSEDRPMFDATCADCGNACKVPFQPNGDKPVFCSDCFGSKKNAGGETSEGRVNLEEINGKLDKILSLLSPIEVAEQVIAEVVEKPAKKKSAKKAQEKVVVEETPTPEVTETPIEEV